MNPDAYVTRSEAALVTGVSKDAIGKWHARGWRSPDGELKHLATKPGKGPHLRYRLGDILQAEKDTRNNPNCRRPNVLSFIPGNSPGHNPPATETEHDAEIIELRPRPPWPDREARRAA